MPASPARESDGKDTAKNINISHLRIKFLWWSEFFLLSLFEDLKKYKIEAEFLERLYNHLCDFKPARTLPCNEDEKEFLKTLFKGAVIVSSP